MSMKDTYEKKLQEQLDHWNEEIDRLKSKAGHVKEDTRHEYHEQLEHIRQKRQEAHAKLQELKAASDDAWEDLKAGIELAWDSLSEAVKSAASRFK
ncbi:coiled coil domain-containing protein [Zooshikella sp. RANM57]|uniref:coiled coil domain-containing protein n=1 Tax=Zooshikella sp. RANM57 TaxID=3425863 RepID=UPI003D6E77C3